MFVLSPAMQAAGERELERCRNGNADDSETVERVMAAVMEAREKERERSAVAAVPRLEPEPPPLQRATYVRLTDGTWGLRVNGPVTLGETVIVDRKDGGESRAKIGRILHHSQTVSIAKIGWAERGYVSAKRLISQRG